MIPSYRVCSGRLYPLKPLTTVTAIPHSVVWPINNNNNNNKGDAQTLSVLSVDNPSQNTHTHCKLSNAQIHCMFCRSDAVSVQFTASHIVLLSGYPQEEDGMNLVLAVAIALPGETTQFIPQVAGVAISLRSATPFYLQTGRPLVRVSAYGDGSESLIVALGTSIPLLLVLLTVLALLIW